jgi:hypothetical protein
MEPSPIQLYMVEWTYLLDYMESAGKTCYRSYHTKKISGSLLHITACERTAP